MATDSHSNKSHVHSPHIPSPGKDFKYRDKPDQRVRINLAHAPHETLGVSPPPNDGNGAPYKWICKLRMNFRGARRDGTGFLVNIPGSTKCTLLTAAHCLYYRNGSIHGYMDSIEVTFPGQKSVTISGKGRFMVPHKYEEAGAWDTDYGIIILDDTKLETETCGFGLSAMLLDRFLLQSQLNVFGYPKGEPDLWGTGGQTQAVESGIVRYLLQATPGQSGSPVFLWYEGFWTVIGIHTFAEQRGGWILNSAVRLNPAVMHTIARWIQHPTLGMSISFAGKHLSIPEKAPDGPGWYGKLQVVSSAEHGTPINLVPVCSFPEASDMNHLSNQWLMISDTFSKPSITTAICVDTCIDSNSDIGTVVEKQQSLNIGTCAHLRRTPVLRRTCELFTLSARTEVNGEQHWTATSVRYPEVALKVVKRSSVVLAVQSAQDDS